MTGLDEAVFGSPKKSGKGGSRATKRKIRSTIAMAGREDEEEFSAAHSIGAPCGRMDPHPANRTALFCLLIGITRQKVKKLCGRRGGNLNEKTAPTGE